MFFINIIAGFILFLCFIAIAVNLRKISDTLSEIKEVLIDLVNENTN